MHRKRLAPARLQKSYSPHGRLSLVGQATPR
jgi:hypothetical protein